MEMPGSRADVWMLDTTPSSSGRSRTIVRRDGGGERPAAIDVNVETPRWRRPRRLRRGVPGRPPARAPALLRKYRAAKWDGKFLLSRWRASTTGSRRATAASSTTSTATAASSATAGAAPLPSSPPPSSSTTRSSILTTCRTCTSICSRICPTPSWATSPSGSPRMRTEEEDDGGTARRRPTAVAEKCKRCLPLSAAHAAAAVAALRAEPGGALRRSELPPAPRLRLRPTRFPPALGADATSRSSPVAFCGQLAPRAALHR